MKLTINKDNKCIKCKVAICCDDEWKTPSNHNFCWFCGEPIEWITERTAEEVLEDIVQLVRNIDCATILSSRDEYLKKLNSLKQELLNKINK